jgi:hypothetical protein
MDEKISLWKRVYGVLWGSPGRTLAGIVEAPRFWGLALLATAVSFLSSIPMVIKTGQLSAMTIQNTPGMTLTAEQVDGMAKYVTYGTGAFMLVLPFLIWLVSAALLKLFNAFSGEKASFKSLLAVSVYAYLPVLLEGIIKAPLIHSAPAQNMTGITLSPALFLPPPEGLAPDRLYTFLSQLDPFMIWSLVLTALGASLAMKVPLGRVAAYLGSLWLLFVLGVTFLSRSPGV